MENFKEECISKGETIRKLQLYISQLERLINVKNKEIKICISQKEEYKAALQPTKDSLDSMTAQYGRIVRKLKRNKNTNT